MTSRWLQWLIAAFLFAVTPAFAQPAAVPPAPAANDYSQDANWLCRPGRAAGQDPCAIDLTTAVVSGDGSVTREPHSANANAPIDCFYVYPTISTDPGTNSDMVPDPAETNVVAHQFARFGSVCRLFAPMYRQVTLVGLRQVMTGSLSDLGRGLAYNDVRDAWRDYLKRDNRGRGVVLIGHSQGTFILLQLLREEIEGTPVQQQLVSAILMGGTVTVPKGQRTGGTFKSLAPCQSASETGCLITFSTYRSTIPAPANALFGRAPEGQVAVCVNPVTFTGEAGDLHAYFGTTRPLIAQAQPITTTWVTGKTIAEPWVSVPGLLSAKCVTNEHATFLEITVRPNPADPRTDDIPGDLGVPGKPVPNWGLHLVDVNLAMGNLVDVVRKQSAAWTSRSRGNR